MKRGLHKILICPFDHNDLDLQVFVREKADGASPEEEEIIEGLMTCSECNRYYPIIKGIPIMSPDEYRQFEYEQPMLQEWSDKIEGLPSGRFRLRASNNGS